MDSDFLAYVNHLHYEVPQDNANDAYDYIDNKVSDNGFFVDRGNSDHNILTLYNNNDNMLSISHRGTSKSDDVVSDLAFGVGLEAFDNQFEERRKRTKDIMKSYNDKQPETYLSGHSLGGSTVNYTIAKSPSIAKNMTEAHTFNPAIHPFNSNLKIDNPEHLKILNEKTTLHRAGGDLVSKWSSSNNQFGKLKKYKVHKKKQGTIASHSLNHFSSRIK